MERFILEEQEEQRPAALTWKYGNKIFEIADRGMVMFIGGEKGSYKSTLARAIISAGLAEDGYMNFNYDRNGKDIVYVDTEMPAHLFRRGQEDMLRMAGLERFPENYKAYRLAMEPDPIKKRAHVVDYINNNKDNIDMLVLDGLADLVADAGSTIEANILLQDVLSLAEKSDSLLVCISHTNEDGRLLNVLGRQLERKARVGYILHKTLGWVIMRPGKETYEPLATSEFRVTDERLLEPGPYVPFGIFEKKKVY